MAEYDFLLARIHGKLSRMLTRADVQTLENAEMDAIIQRLQDTSYEDSLGEGASKRMSDGLLRGFLTDVKDLFRPLQGDDRELLSSALSCYRVENLKTLIRTQFHQFPPERAKERILHLPWEPIDYDQLLALPGLEEMLHQIPWPAYRIRLEAVHRQLGETASALAYEAAADNVYLESLIWEYERREADVRDLLRNRLLRRVLSWTFRLREYGYSFPETVNLLPDIRPLISQHELRGIVEDGDGWRRLARVFGNDLAREWQEAVTFDTELADSLFDRQLIQLVRRQLIVSRPRMALILGYVYMKEIELGWLTGVAERARMASV